MKLVAIPWVGYLLAVTSVELAQPAYTVDPDFNPAITVPQLQVRGVAVQGDGRIYLAGSFVAVDGFLRPGLVRLKATGGVDESFVPALAGGDDIASVVLQPDGNLLVAGSSRNRAETPWVTRIDAVGRRDPGFRTDLPDHRQPGPIILQDDGKVLVALRLPDARPGPSLIIRLDSTGRRDPSFAPVELWGDGSALMGMLLQPDGRLLVWGYFTRIGQEARVGVVRLTPDGRIDPTFRHTLRGEFPGDPWVGVHHVALLPDGKLFVVGFLKGGAHRLNPDGSTDQLGLSGGRGPTLVQADGRLIVHFDDKFTRLNRTGRPDWSLIPTDDGGFSQYRSGRAWSLLPAGGVLMETKGEIKKLMPDGTPDPSFASTATDVPGLVVDFVQQPDGKIVFIGDFARVNGVPRPSLARLNANGSLDLSFVPDSNLRFIESIWGCSECPAGVIRYQLSDSKIIVAGQRGIVRLNPDGSLDAGFHPVELPDTVIGLEPVSDGTWYVAFRSGIVRLKTDGSVDEGFQWSGIPVAIRVQGDRKLLVSHGNGINGPISGLIRLNTDGSLDAGFMSKMEYVRHILLQPDGRIVAGSVQLIARLNTDGTPDLSFGRAGELWMERIDDLALLSGNRLAVFGTFNYLGNGPLFGDGSANLLVINAEGQFAGEAGRISADPWDPNMHRRTRRALPMTDGGFLLAGPVARDNSLFGLDLVRVRPSPVVRSVRRNSDGSIELRIGGRPDWTYSVETSANLVDWTTLREVPSEGAITQVNDTPPAGQSQRFYRTTLKP